MNQYLHDFAFAKANTYIDLVKILENPVRGGPSRKMAKEYFTSISTLLAEWDLFQYVHLDEVSNGQSSEGQVEKKKVTIEESDIGVMSGSELTDTETEDIDILGVSSKNVQKKKVKGGSPKQVKPLRAIELVRKDLGFSKSLLKKVENRKAVKVLLAVTEDRYPYLTRSEIREAFDDFIQVKKK